MPKALFVTSHTNEIGAHVDAWNAVSDVPAAWIAFNYLGIRADGRILDAAEQARPDVIFYLGANAGAGLPTEDTLRRLKTMAPSVNLVCDAADEPLHVAIKHYRKKQCFDLHVGLDGAPDSPVDLVTLTPVSCRAFSGSAPKRDIRCGFSGGIGGKRSRVLGALGSRVWLRLRGEDYADHVNFLRRCRMVVNTAFTGSGHAYHIKGRVLETGYAGAALLEHTESPIRAWFPTDAYFGYRDPEHAIDIIETASEDEIAACAERLSGIVREKYNAARIYGAILDKLGIPHSLEIPKKYL